ncbi:unnamed protein product [Owenia fusiformis]|uniref:C2H2-type domain-containing protein n=1 Tax=Owenia fusiformis TaxID=6347 RepID=A0A8S4PEB0_OWEFU|nr:unnamed protein product [Owenia fusiformis]
MYNSYFLNLRNIYTFSMAHICHFCGAGFTTKYNMQRHLRSVHQLNLHHNLSFICDQCPAIYTRKEKLEEHVNSKHPSDSSPVFTCNECSKTFAYKRLLKRHEETHSDVTFYCDICLAEKGFDVGVHCYTTKANLNRHKNVAHGGVELVLMPCPQCGKTFYKRNSLQRHMKRKH